MLLTRFGEKCRAWCVCATAVRHRLCSSGSTRLRFSLIAWPKLPKESNGICMNNRLCWSPRRSKKRWKFVWFLREMLTFNWMALSCRRQFRKRHLLFYVRSQRQMTRYLLMVVKTFMGPTGSTFCCNIIPACVAGCCSEGWKCAIEFLVWCRPIGVHLLFGLVVHFRPIVNGLSPSTVDRRISFSKNGMPPQQQKPTPIRYRNVMLCTGVVEYRIWLLECYGIGQSIWILHGWAYALNMNVNCFCAQQQYLVCGTWLMCKQIEWCMSGCLFPFSFDQTIR